MDDSDYAIDGVFVVFLITVEKEILLLKAAFKRRKRICLNLHFWVEVDAPVDIITRIST